ncbi:hypothetical protein EMCRGX_G033498 [Ephydatia muelleri]
MVDKDKGVAIGGYLLTCIAGVRKQWFMIGMVLVILLAQLRPALGCKGGLLKPEFTVKYIAVSLIFLNSGLSVKTEDLKKALLLVKLHLFIQLYTFAFIPIMSTLVIATLAHSFGMLPIYMGLHTVSCLPPPVSTAVLLSKAAHGNEAAAIFNSVLGSFLGIIITPLLLLSLVGSSTTPSLSFIIGQLILTVVLPLVMGQVVKPYIQKHLDQLSPPFSAISSGILLFIIYTTFCDAFKGSVGNLELNTILMAIFFGRCAVFGLVVLVIVSCILRSIFGELQAFATIFMMFLHLWMIVSILNYSCAWFMAFTLQYNGYAVLNSLLGSQESRYCRYSSFKAHLSHIVNPSICHLSPSDILDGCYSS